MQEGMFVREKFVEKKTGTLNGCRFKYSFWLWYSSEVAPLQSFLSLTALQKWTLRYTFQTVIDNFDNYLCIICFLNLFGENETCIKL